MKSRISVLWLGGMVLLFGDPSFGGTTPLTSQVHLIELGGGNITALVTQEGTLLVDDDFAESAAQLVEELKRLGGDRPRFIINTHFHYDHTGGNEVFGTTATIIAAKSTRERLMREQVLWKERHPAAPPLAWPTLTFEDSLQVHLGGEEVKVLHLEKGHTDGDSIVFFKNAKVVSLGDLYFAGMYPIFHPEHGGSLDKYINNIEKIITQIPDDAKIVPGHGPLSNKTELIQYHAMIVDTAETVKKAVREGLSLAQIQQKGLNPKWEPFSHGYVKTERWIEVLYQHFYEEYWKQKMRRMNRGH